MPQYDRESFEKASEPLIKWLNENANPHSVVVVEVDSARFYSGEVFHLTSKFIKD